MSDKNIGIVILAAGQSARFGSPKQLAEFEGETLIERVCNTAVSTGFPTVVVLGAYTEEIAMTIDALPVKVSVNKNWEKGLSSSIKKGVEKLIESDSNLSAVILLLCDQPLITVHTLNNLVNTQVETGKSIIASSYSSTVGTPALFSKNMFLELVNLEGDRGAKVLIEKHRDSDVALVEAPEAGRDIDKETDFKRIYGS